MLVQRRASGLRLFRQHDHALAAAALAHEWDGGGGEALPLAVVLAVALHDVAWIPLDTEPRLDPSRGGPHDFMSHPAAEKLEAYARGLDTVETLLPAAALLGSLHYGSFVTAGADGGGGEAGRGFLEGERTRRARIRAGGSGGPDLGGLDVDEGLELLRFFDRMSLLLCLSAPGAAPGSLPAWLEPAGRLRAPAGRVLRTEWRGDGRLALAPFPFRRPLSLAIPYRDLPAGPFGGKEALRAAWASSPPGTWRVVVAPG
ncbi:MAG TPA: DUF3891 family protein [Gemmatimonadota bacterium]|nr:DUF3891 family protein [Gemmatimonadota bacterium]